jgi:hypothetical protein
MRRGPIYLLRSAIAAVFGVASKEAKQGGWWEIDLLLVVLAGALLWGAAAWGELLFPVG